MNTKLENSTRSHSQVLAMERHSHNYSMSSIDSKMQSLKDFTVSVKRSLTQLCVWFHFFIDEYIAQGVEYSAKGGLGNKDVPNDIGHAAVNFGSSDDDGMDSNGKINEDSGHVDDITVESAVE